MQEGEAVPGCADGVDGIPVIDLGCFFKQEGPTEEEEKRTAKEVFDALHEIGFMYIKNAAVPTLKVRLRFRIVLVIQISAPPLPPSCYSTPITHCTGACRGV